MDPAWLTELMRRHPCWDERDVLKALFQAECGNGHLLGNFSEVERRIRVETENAGPSRGEPLTERVGDRLRLHLRPARDLGLEPAWITRMMLGSLPADPDSRDRLIRSVCAPDFAIPGTDAAVLRSLARELALDPRALPLHSDVCHQREAPAYRVIDAAWEPVLDVLRAYAAARSEKPRMITVDGRCGSGKSTLGRAIGAVLACPVLYMDDYYTPHVRKTPERLAIPGGNCDIERLAREVIEPFAAGRPVTLRRYNCETRDFEDSGDLPACGLLVLEGSYSNLPPIPEAACVRVFLEITPELQAERILKRGGPEAAKRFADIWIPLEEAYFGAYRLPDEGCLRIDAAGLRLERVLTGEELA